MERKWKLIQRKKKEKIEGKKEKQGNTRMEEETK